MSDTTTVQTILRRTGVAALAIATSASLTAAQPQQPPLAQPPSLVQPERPGAPQRNPVCLRLEGQLAMVDRGQADPQRAEQIRRYEETANRQQVELDRLASEARRLGCGGGGFFSLFGGQPQQCGPLANRMQQMRDNLGKVLSDLERLRGNSADREGERRAILASLAQNDCGPQYRQYAARPQGGGGFLDNLFGGATVTSPDMPPPVESGAGGTFRTVCVRTCDGFYFPVSYSTTPASFPQDEQTCQRMCPASEVALYSHRNPGEDMSQAVSMNGSPYTQLPNAFAFRKAVNSACSCRAPGQTWADALKDLDDPVERGDIVVTEEQAKALSQPTEPKGKGAPKGKAQPKAAEPAATPAPQPAQPNAEPGKRTVRTVGPPFLPKN